MVRSRTSPGRTNLIKAVKEEGMEPRFEYAKVARGVYETMSGLEKYIRQSGLEEPLLHLIKLRASQINGCAYCIDMHWKDLRSLNESEQRMYGLNACEESPYYTSRERAALAWTEAVTKIREGHVPDEVYQHARTEFSEKELADLTLAVAAINAWNRLAISARTTPGTYQPAKRELKQEAQERGKSNQAQATGP
jgi:AhpD family alkylhydroperoxidase